MTTRRGAMGAIGAGLLAAGGARAQAQEWRPASRFPDPAIGVLDPRFARYRIASATVERVATGCTGPRGRCGWATPGCCC